jgi:hypothetical protein
MTEKKLTINTKNNILLNSSSTIKTNNSIILKDNNAITSNKLYKIYKALSYSDSSVNDILVIPQMTINKSYCVINVKAYYNKIQNDPPFDKVFGYIFSTFNIYYNDSGYTNTNIKLEESSAGAVAFSISNTISNITLRVQNTDTNYSSISYSFVIEYHYNNFS